LQLRQLGRAHERQCGLWRSGFGKGSTSFDWRYQLDIGIESQRPEIAAAAHLSSLQPFQRKQEFDLKNSKLPGSDRKTFTAGLLPQDFCSKTFAARLLQQELCKKTLFARRLGPSIGSCPLDPDAGFTPEARQSRRRSRISRLTAISF
jgi:hypothetical protein